MDTVESILHPDTGAAGEDHDSGSGDSTPIFYPRRQDMMRGDQARKSMNDFDARTQNRNSFNK